MRWQWIKNNWNWITIHLSSKKNQKTQRVEGSQITDMSLITKMMNDMYYMHHQQSENCSGHFIFPAELEKLGFEHYNQARIQRGGGARPPLFVANSLKSPLNWPKYAENIPQTLGAPSFFKSRIRP